MEGDAPVEKKVKKVKKAKLADPGKRKLAKPTKKAGAAKNANKRVWGRLVSLNPQVDNILLSDAVVLGKGADCTVRFQDKRISRRHTKIGLVADKDEEHVAYNVELEDTSTNGTYVNGKKLGKNVKQRLLHGDEVTLLQRPSEDKEAEEPPADGPAPIRFLSFVFQNLMEHGDRFAGVNDLQGKELVKTPAGGGELGDGTSSIAQTPEGLLQMMRVEAMPHTLKTLKMTLKRGQADFMSSFLQLDGLNALLDVLEESERKVKKTEYDHDIEREALSCLKSLMQDETGFEAVLRTEGAVRKLALIFSSDNIQLKQKSLKLLSAICLFSPAGHAQVLDAVTHYKEVRRERKRFKHVVASLKLDDADVEYKTDVLTFINAVVNTPEEVDQRVPLREEFKKLDLLTLFSYMRNEDDEDLDMQIDVFEDEMKADENAVLCRGIDLSDPLHLGKALKAKLTGTAQYQSLVSIFQHLLLVPATEEMLPVWTQFEVRAHEDLSPAADEDLFKNKRVDVMALKAAVENDDSIIGSVDLFDDDDEDEGEAKAAFQLVSNATGSMAREDSQHDVATATLKRQITMLQGELDTVRDATAMEKSAEPVVVSLKNELAQQRTATENAETRAKAAEEKVAALSKEMDELKKKMSDVKTGSVKIVRASASAPAPPPPPPPPGAPAAPGGGPPPPAPPPPPFMGGGGPPPPAPPPPPGMGGGGPPPPAPPPPPFMGGGGGPPPPPPPPGMGGGPPPPPPPPGMGGGPPPPPPPPGMGGGPPPPPPPPGGGPPGPPPPPGGPPGPPPPPGGRGPPPPPGMARGPAAALKPKVKMKQLHWTKVPNMKVNKTIWVQPGQSDKLTLKVDEIEALFCAARPKKKAAGPAKEKKKPSIITLLDMKRSNNVGIARSRFKMTDQEVVNAIFALDDSKLSVENIKTLIDIAPTKEETETLLSFEGDKTKLGKSEKFFLALLIVPKLELRLRAFLFKLMFDDNVDDIKSDFEILETSCQQVTTSMKFRCILKFVLQLGNFMNGGSFRGNARGVKVDVLLKLADTKSCDNKTTLLHYVARKISEMEPELLEFPKTLAKVEPAARVMWGAVEQVIGEVNKGCKTSANALNAVTTVGPHDKFLGIMTDYVKKAEAELATIQKKREQLAADFKKVAVFFGEDASKFKVEEFMGRIHSFILAFEKSIKDNKREDMIRKKKEAKEKAKAEKKAAKGTKKSKKGVMDDLYKTLRGGKAFIGRKRATGKSGTKKKKVLVKKKK